MPYPNEKQKVEVEGKVRVDGIEGGGGIAMLLLIMFLTFVYKVWPVLEKFLNAATLYLETH